MTTTTLADAMLGRRVRIAGIDVDDDAARWLDALGLCEGEDLVVLRHAIFGGPIHVRTSSGGEFAIARELATKIRVRREDERR